MLAPMKRICAAGTRENVGRKRPHGGMGLRQCAPQTHYAVQGSKAKVK